MKGMKIMEEKKNKNMVVIIIILCLLLVGAVGFIVYDKAIKTNQNNISNLKEESAEEIYSKVQSKIKNVMEVLSSPDNYVNGEYVFSKDFTFYDYAVCFEPKQVAQVTDDFKAEMIQKGYVDEDLNGQLSIDEYPFIPSSIIKQNLIYAFGSDELYNKFLQEVSESGGYIKSIDGFIFLPGGVVENKFDFSLDKYEMNDGDFKVYYNGVLNDDNQTQRRMVLTLKKINGEFYLDNAKLI